MSDQLAGLKALLEVTKQAPADKIDEDYFNLMVKAKEALGDSSYQMAHFYYAYGNHMLSKVEKETDIFNAGAMPANVHEEAEEELRDIEDQNGIQDSSIEQEHPDPDQPEVEEEAPVQKEGMNEEPRQEEEDDDDKNICFFNLQTAVNILEKERDLIQNKESQQDIVEVLDTLRRARTRLGDLYMLEERFKESITEFLKVIDQEYPRGGKSSRLVAELHFMVGNALLYQSVGNCQVEAIRQYLMAIEVLGNHLTTELSYDISSIQLPTIEKTNISRVGYLPKPGDSDTVREIKDIMSCICDKIEDTQLQLGEKGQYEEEKRKMAEDQQKNEFKPVADTEKVVNLGSFGNRKKKQEGSQPTIQQPATITLPSPAKKNEEQGSQKQ